MFQRIGINPKVLGNDELIALYWSLTLKDDRLDANLYRQRSQKDTIAASMQPLLMELWERRLLTLLTVQQSSSSSPSSPVNEGKH